MTTREILSVVIDITPSWFGLNFVKSFGVQQYLDCCLSFINSYLTLSSTNEVSIYLVLGSQTVAAWPLSPKRTELIKVNIPSDGKIEAYSIMNEAVLKIAKKSIAEFKSNKLTANFSNAVIKCLCYYMRRRKETDPSFLTNAFSERNDSNTHDLLKSRILIIKATPDCPTQYLSLMNAIFTAQKLEIPIDCCIVLPMKPETESDGSVTVSANTMRGVVAKNQNQTASRSSLFQQASNLTGGIYLETPHPSALLQYLISVFLANKSFRSNFVLPNSRACGIGVDFRSACFCHRQLVDQAYICSICLTVLCEFSPICITCHSQFVNPLTKNLEKSMIDEKEQ